jgi:hypothetical protein
LEEAEERRETQPTAPVAKQQKINQTINQSINPSQKTISPTRKIIQQTPHHPNLIENIRYGGRKQNIAEVGY